MTPILGDILESVAADEPRISIVARIGADADPVAAAERCRADVVVTDAAGEYAGWLRDRILFAHPRLRLLTLAQQGRVAHLDRLVPQRTSIVDVSPQALVETILGATPSEAGTANPGRGAAPRPRPEGKREVDPWK